MSDAPDLTTLAGQKAHYAAVQRRLMRSPPSLQRPRPLPRPTPVPIAKTALTKPIHVRHMIMCIVCELSGVHREQLLSSSRNAHLVWPRHIGMHLMRAATTDSFVAIARRFGGRDHSTASHSIDTVQCNLVEPNPDIALAVNAIRYCRDRGMDPETFEECLRRAARMLLQACMEYIAVRNAKWSEHMRSKPPRLRRDGGKFA